MILEIPGSGFDLFTVEEQRLLPLDLVGRVESLLEHSALYLLVFLDVLVDMLHLLQEQILTL